MPFYSDKVKSLLNLHWNHKNTLNNPCNVQLCLAAVELHKYDNMDLRIVFKTSIAVVTLVILKAPRKEKIYIETKATKNRKENKTG